MTLTLRRGVAFLLGFGFSFLPTYAPFLALLYFLAERWRFRRFDAVILVAALLAGLPLALTGGLGAAALSTAQLVAAWLLFRSFNQLRTLRATLLNPRLVGLGLVSGLAMVVAMSLLQIDRINPLAKVTQAIVWRSSPALYGHTVLVLGAVIAVLAPSVAFRLASLALSALGILLSGSREAAIAWVFVALALLVLSPARSRRNRTLEGLMVATMLVVAAGLGSFLGWGNVGFLLDLAPASASPNELQGTEIARGDWWFDRGVKVTPGKVDLDGRTLTSYRIEKTAAEPWYRLQQVVPVQPDEPYTVSVWLRTPENDAWPGVQGWGEQIDSKETFVVTAALIDGSWRVNASGSGRLLSSGALEGEGDWQRVWFTFVYQGEGSLYWWLGMAPDQRTIVGDAAEFAGFQLERSDQIGTYTPGSATQGLGLSSARIPYWQAAWQGILRRPLLGWGADAFFPYYEANWSDRGQLREVPSHAHNLLLQVWFERGTVGLLGLLLFLATLFGTALRRRDAPFLAVLGGVFIANTFDHTLFYGGVLYPLAAAAGWRAGSVRRGQSEGEEAARQGGVRLVLAAVDFLMALLALTLATKLHALFAALSGVPLETLPFTPAIYYALLLWPAMSWREGLYPGYGLTPTQELRRQATAVAAAGLILAAGTLLFAGSLPLTRFPLVAMIVLTLGLLPSGRALTKRLLVRLGLWGQAVFVLGAGKAGRRVAGALRRTPMNGLNPVAFFDDDPAKIGQCIDGVPVRGTLMEAGDVARREGIRHAIVTISKASADTLTSILSVRGRAFRTVQVVPDIPGLPVLGVEASSLDNLLALEVKNELSSNVNRTFKRTLDLVGALVGGLLISPLLALLAIAIALDSRGPILFGHRRLGRDGKPFLTWKFRTMVVDAEAVLNEHLAAHPELRSEWEASHKLHNDPRVTRVGRWLRRTSLDELPQLWNVLVGEMSLVGPRPIVDEEVPRYRNAYELYKMVRPGMTGYWQVSGRSDTDYDHRVDLDSFYVRNWSVWLDIIILVQTVTVVVQGDGAY